MGVRYHRVSEKNCLQYYTPSSQLVGLNSFKEAIETITGISIAPLFDHPKERPADEAQLLLPFPKTTPPKHQDQAPYCPSKNYYPNLETIKQCLVSLLHTIENDATVKKTLDQALLKIEAYFHPKEAQYRAQQKERLLQQKKLRQQRIQNKEFCASCINEVFCTQEEDCINAQLGESPFYRDTHALDEVDALVYELYRYLHFILKAETNNAQVIHWDVF